MLKKLLALTLLFSIAIAQKVRVDFGAEMQAMLTSRSMELFGIAVPLPESAPATEGDYRRPTQTAAEQVLLAGGLEVRYLTREAGEKTDMIVLWPDETNPTHLITCVEGGREVISTQTGLKYNPSVQRISLANGSVETIIRGMDHCDGIRSTSWGTILATEEAGDGFALEVMNPLVTSEVTIVDRSNDQLISAFGDASSMATIHRALPRMAWEGLTVLESGVIIGGDELRPGLGKLDSDGGAIFKFVPDNPHQVGQISSLDQSPLISGNTYALQASCREVRSDSFPQYGQGCEIGVSAWVKVDAFNARVSANERGATGFHRPEDLHKDPTYQDGVRFCWANTGRNSAANYGEVICGIDETPLGTGVIVDERAGMEYLANGEGYAFVTINRFVEGDEELNAPDNLAFQPSTGILYVIEDNANGDIWACLPDGSDRDVKTDGCIRVLSVKDSSAEPTGFIFTADGKTAYVSVQHSADGHMPSVDGYPTDDVLVITGF